MHVAFFGGNLQANALSAAVGVGIIIATCIWYFWPKRMRIQPRSLPSLKGALVKIHRDLLVIEDGVLGRHAEADWKLSEFEKLILVLEDRRFLGHNGVDFRASFRETIKTLSFRKHGGASTIDMQFVRTLTGYRDYTLRRKLYEMLLARLLQYRYSKLRILRSYLKCAFFGSHLYGCDDAAKVVFGKSIWQIDREEAAQLAAMLVYPRPQKPTEGWRLKIERRAAYGLKRFERLKKRFEKIPRGEHL